MNKKLHQKLSENASSLSVQLELAGVSESELAFFVISEMEKSIEEEHWEAWYTLLAMVYAVPDYKMKVSILNQLLAMPGHELHQEITKELQDLASPESIEVIKKVLETEFSYLQYTCSDDEVITKWFSWALAEIGTPEAIEVIREYSLSDNNGIRREMSYRLSQIDV